MTEDSSWNTQRVCAKTTWKDFLNERVLVTTNSLQSKLGKLKIVCWPVPARITIFRLICGQLKCIKFHFFYVLLLRICYFSSQERRMFASYFQSKFNNKSTVQSRERNQTKQQNFRSKGDPHHNHILAFTFSRSISQSFLILSIFLRLYSSLMLRRCLHKIYNFNRFFDDSRRNCVLFHWKGFRSSSSSCHCVIRTEAKIPDRNLLVSNNTMNSGKGQKITTALLKSIIAWSLIPITAPRDNCDRFFCVLFLPIFRRL